MLDTPSQTPQMSDLSQAHFCEQRDFIIVFVRSVFPAHANVCSASMFLPAAKPIFLQPQSWSTILPSHTSSSAQSTLGPAHPLPLPYVKDCL